MRLPDPDYEDRETGPIPAIYRRLADTIQPFRKADGAPPQRLWQFLGWALEG